MNADTMAQLTNLASLATKPIDKFTKRIEQLNAKLAELESAGWAEATPSYKDGKYLYLIYPTQPDGSRRREYIGADPEKQKAALTRISRHEERNQVIAQIASVDWQIRRAVNALTEYHRILG